jgi:tetratricopeptide (TPR) repeat protein
MGMLLQAHALSSEAAVYYVQAEQLNPTEPRWPYLHAHVIGDDPPTALGLLRRSAGLCEGLANAPDAPLLKEADACLDQGLLEEAAAAYRKLLNRQPGHPRAELGLARVAVCQGQADSALPHLQVCARHPLTRRAAHILMAEVHRRLGNFKAAQSVTDKTANLDEDAPWPDPWLDEVRALLVGRQARLGHMQQLYHQGKVREATDFALVTTAEYPDVGLLAIGRRRLQERKWTQAEAALREALRLNETSAEGHFDLGTALWEQKRYSEAAASFKRVTELEPAYGPAYREWARCAEAGGDRVEALRLLRQAIQYLPHRSDIHRALGELLAAMGRRDEALHHLDLARRLNPDDRRTRELHEELRRGAEGKKP